MITFRDLIKFLDEHKGSDKPVYVCGRDCEFAVQGFQIKEKGVFILFEDGKSKYHKKISELFLGSSLVNQLVENVNGSKDNSELNVYLETEWMDPVAVEYITETEDKIVLQV